MGARIFTQSITSLPSLSYLSEILFPREREFLGTGFCTHMERVGGNILLHKWNFCAFRNSSQDPSHYGGAQHASLFASANTLIMEEIWFFSSFLFLHGLYSKATMLIFSYFLSQWSLHRRSCECIVLLLFS